MAHVEPLSTIYFQPFFWSFKALETEGGPFSTFKPWPRAISGSCLGLGLRLGLASWLLVLLPGNGISSCEWLVKSLLKGNEIFHMGNVVILLHETIAAGIQHGGNHVNILMGAVAPCNMYDRM